MLRPRVTCFGIAGVFLACAGAHAHHSYSEYDDTQIVEIEGTLVAVALQNPHSYFSVRGKGENAEVVTWRLESGTRNSFQRTNLPLELFEIGSSVKFAGWPSKRSSDRMYALNMLADGKEVLLFRDAKRRWAETALGFGTQEAQSRLSRGGVANGTGGLFRVWASNLDGVMRPTAPLVLTEQAQKAVAAFDPINDSTEKGCTPKGMPRLMSQPPPMEFIDRGDTIALRTEEYDTVRTIHMTASPNPEAQPRTPLGYSVGRWDGNALVVETSRVNFPYLNAAGVPLGPDARFVERFEPTADGSRLDYTLEVTDPYSLAVPAEFKRFWVWRPGEQVLPFNCTEPPVVRE
jgi:hypothetical protein